MSKAAYSSPRTTSGFVYRHGDKPSITGEQYVICDVCMCRFKASETALTWDNFVVCSYDWYPKPWFLDPPVVDPNEGTNTLPNPRPKPAITTQNPGANPSIPDYLGTFPV